MNLNRQKEIKILERDIRNMEMDRAEINKNLSSIIEKLTNLKQRKQRLNSNIDEARNKLINLSQDSSQTGMTEHSLLRYFERILGYNLQEIERGILENIKKDIEILGNGKFPVSYKGNDFKVVVRSNTIVTCYFKEDI